MTRRVELLWFRDCPNHRDARRLLLVVTAAVAPGTPVDDIDATDPDAARRLRFPGSPTIRVDGRDVAPGFTDPGDYTPRCRLYSTVLGLRGLPERSWIEAALKYAPLQTTGRAIRKVEPRPGPSLTAQARPFMASATARVMAKPMPDPPSAREREGSAR